MSTLAWVGIVLAIWGASSFMTFVVAPWVTRRMWRSHLSRVQHERPTGPRVRVSQATIRPWVQR